jgi:hypothetical protein
VGVSARGRTRPRTHLLSTGRNARVPRAGVRSGCAPCWGCYRHARRAAEQRLALLALCLRGEVEEGLPGAPALWTAMAVNLAAWRSLPREDRAHRRSVWFAALLDTLAEALGL